MKKAYLIFVLALVAFASLQGCSGGKATSDSGGKEIAMGHARLLQLEEIGRGVTLVTIRSPWDSTAYLGRYALVEEGNKPEGNLPEGTQVINVPVRKSVVYSGIHTAVLNELGVLDAVKGMCDVAYVSDSATNRALKSGKIVDCGQNTSPVMERIISLRPDLVILSPYETSDESSRFAPIGINVLEAADYMEKTPLGRAEWIRLFGRLYGCGERADSLFAVIESEYNGLRQKAMKSSNKPSVLFDRLYSGVWNVPTSGSVTGIMIEDAGGRNPFASYTEGGAAHLTGEEVLHTAQNADIWLVRHSEPSVSLKSLAADSPLYSRFKAFRDGKVYGANTLDSRLFEDGAFHPEKVLREMIRLLHPELESTPLTYYTKLK